MAHRVALSLLAAAVIVSAAAAQAPAGANAPYVMNRLTMERMEALVEAPLALVASGDIEGARTSFERMLSAERAARGESSVEAADLLMSFGAMLHREGSIRDAAELRTLAETYTSRAVDAYRLAFGPDHPEFAVALNSHSDILRRASPDDPPDEAERLMAEAYRIRLAALGPSHPETLWTILYLADIRAAPGRARRNPELIDAASAELERAAALSQGVVAEEAPTPGQIHVRRARLFARHGRVEDSRRAMAAAEASQAGRDPTETCLTLLLGAVDVNEALAEAGRPERVEERDIMDCLVPASLRPEKPRRPRPRARSRPS